jgi:ethanolamine utilization protein EutN
MDIARVIGHIVATQKDPSLVSCKLCVIEPLNHDGKPSRKPLIATDATASRGLGELIFFVESGDAVFTGLQGEDLPVDAAIVGIVDEIHPGGGSTGSGK